MKIYVLLVLLIVLGGCAQQAMVEDPRKVSVTEGKVELEIEEAPVVEDVTEKRVIEVTAKQFEFVPDPIEVKLGENVVLKAKSVDVEHGFYIPEFGIDEKLKPNEEVEIEFVADKAGEFDVICNVFCGSGHPGMKGKLIVS